MGRTSNANESITDDARVDRVGSSVNNVDVRFSRLTKCQFELVQGFAFHTYDALVSGLRWLDRNLSINLGGCFVDKDGSSLQVDVTPPECAYFTGSRSGNHCDGARLVHVLAELLSRIKQSLHLFSGWDLLGGFGGGRRYCLHGW